jgi:hypothetical protein
LSPIPSAAEPRTRSLTTGSGGFWSPQTGIAEPRCTGEGHNPRADAADLAGSDGITAEHVSEAIQYRGRDCAR